jgi:hypothetical protein
MTVRPVDKYLQGAALHYVNGQNGIKDFDVWSFYAQYDDWPFPPR